MADWAPRRAATTDTTWVGALGSQRAAQRDAVKAGQHDVEDDQLERRRPRPVERGGAVTQLGDRETGERQMETDELANRRFVLDDQDPARGSRRCPLVSVTAS
jgi:hypothetical protein